MRGATWGDPRPKHGDQPYCRVIHKPEALESLTREWSLPLFVRSIMLTTFHAFTRVALAVIKGPGDTVQAARH